MKKKKIGILTFHYPETMNYGAMLQSYALMSKVKELGYETEIINYKNISSELKERFKNQGINFQKFENSHMNVTHLCKTNKDLKKLNEKFDIFIVGSDQVWRAGKVRFKLKYFFNFVEKSKKKIAYAVSFGLNKWNGHFISTYIIKRLVQKFDFISVREESGIKICKEVFNRNSKCVLDPTLILSKKYYEKIISQEKEKLDNNSYISYMVLDDEKNIRQKSLEIANMLGTKIRYIKNEKEGISKYSTVAAWLNFIKNSELIITDSFHCTAFSIIFHKKFIVIANPRRGNTRLENLLKIVGLENRFFTDIKEVENSGILEKEIDYEEVEKKLDVKRKYSIDFLKNALGEN